MTSNVLDDLTTRFKSFSDAIDFSFANKARSRPESRQVQVEDVKITTKVHQEKEAAAKRAEQILQQLYQGYFDKAFDPLAYELGQMTDDSKQDDIDAIVERLTAAVEVVSVKLAKHVVKNQEKLIAGISNVTAVEDDLQAACTIIQSSRTQLKLAAEEVQRQIKVVAYTRKKQSYMTALEACTKIKKAKDLPALLKNQLENGDYTEAIMMCVDCYQGVETLGKLTVMPELRMTAQRHYYETLQRLDVALQNVCLNFAPQDYSKLLEAYLLQGTTAATLASKVLNSFKEAIQDTATRIVRSMVLSKAGMSESLASSSLEVAYADLCKALPRELLCPCLGKLMEVMFDVLHSYHFMQHWHEAAAAATQEAAETASSSRDAGDEGKPAISTQQEQQQQQVQLATQQLLAGICAELMKNREALWELTASTIRDLLRVPGACKAEDFLQTVEWSVSFGVAGEAFIGHAHKLRPMLLDLCGNFVDFYHRGNMDALRMCLATENWQNVAASSNDGHSISGGMELALKSNPYVLPQFGQPGAQTDFNSWLESGNPFVKGATSKRPRSTHEDAHQRQQQGVPPGAAANHSSTCMATFSSQQVLKWLQAYVALTTAMPGKQQQLWAHTQELFDNYLLACFILFSGVSLETLVWQEECLPHRLRSTLLRIMTREGCKYKGYIEDLERDKPAKPTLAPSSSILDFGLGNSSSSSGSSKFDAFTKKFKDTMVDLINTDLSQPLPSSSSNSPYGTTPLQQSSPQTQQQSTAANGRQQQQAPQQPQRSPTPKQLQPLQVQQKTGQQQQQAGGPDGPGGTVTGPSGGSTLARQSAGLGTSGTNAAVALKERVVAIESLMGIAAQLRSVKPLLLATLNGAAQGMGKDVEAYFSRTVDATQDLKDAIYRGAAKGWLQAMLDPERGIAPMVANTNYSVKEPASSYQPWAEGVCRCYRIFQEQVAASGLPPDIQKQMWEHGVKMGAEVMLLGLARVRHCSVEGRAGMSLDLSYVEKTLRPIAPASAMISLRLVDNYIKAFYLPWEELGRWAQIHVAEYGKEKILMLIEVMAEAYGVKRGVKNALLEKLNADLAEFG